MNPVLRPQDIADAVRETLSGRSSKQALSSWAFHVWLDDDTGRRKFDERYHQEIDDVLHDLWYMDGVPEMELSDADLQALITRMEHLESYDG